MEKITIYITDHLSYESKTETICLEPKKIEIPIVNTAIKRFLAWHRQRKKQSEE